MSSTNVVEMNKDLLSVQSERASSLSIVTNDANMARAVKLAELMASSKITVPKHLQGNVGDCLAIALQAMNFGMDAFVVAQKTHIVNGALGYEAQLVNAIVQSSNAIKGAFNYEYKDEGGSGATSYVTCRVGAVLNGQKDITWGEWLPSANITTRNSPNWKTNIKQQMGYLQVKNWARLYCPAAIMGVYSVDELQDMPPKDLNEAPAKSRRGADIARESQQNTGGTVIDQKQEEYRANLIKILDGFAVKGTIEFMARWKAVGKENKNDAYLVGEAEFNRMFAIAEDADVAAINQDEQAPIDPFVAEMQAAESAQ